MNRDRDLDRSLDSWFAEGPTALPEHAVDAIVRRLEDTNQRRPSWLPGGQRMNRMTPWIGFAAAGLAAVAALVYLNPGAGGGLGGQPVATPSPSPSPSPSGTPTSHVLWAPARGEAGVRITVTLPPGWEGEPGSGILDHARGDLRPEDAAMIGPFVNDDIYVPADPCQWSSTLPDSPATTVDELVAALQGQASRDASEPVDITVDGHAGKSITLRVPNDAVFSECDPFPGDPEGRFCTLAAADAADCQRYHQFPGQIDELWIVDVDGQMLVIDAMRSDATPAELRAELRAILESMTFESP